MTRDPERDTGDRIHSSAAVDADPRQLLELVRPGDAARSAAERETDLLPR